MNVMQWVILITGMMLLFNLAGFVTTTGYITGVLGFNGQGIGDANPTAPLSNFKASAFFLDLLTVVGLISTVGTIAAGLLTGSADLQTFLSVSLFAIWALFLGDLIALVAFGSSGPQWIGYVMMAIGVPLVFGFAVSIINYVTGRV